jgi:amino acid transporter
MTDRTAVSNPQLVRAMGRWSVAALILNIVIGASVFGLPKELAALLGPLSPWAYLAAGGIILCIAACFAEVSSYFDQTGGPYLYAREAYGVFVATLIAWLMILVRIASVAANANLLVPYLSQFFPALGTPLARAAVITAFLWGIAYLNIRGVRTGAVTSDALAWLKVAVLALFIGAGVYFVFAHGRSAPPNALQTVTAASWFEALLLLIFGYGGFEAALVPMAEAKNPKRDAPIALFTVIGLAIALYTLVQVTVVLTFPGAATSGRPLAEAAAVSMGSAGPLIIGVGSVVSIVGYLVANLLSGPRVIYAFAERGDAPRFLARTSASFKTPVIAIVLFTVCTWAFALLGSFRYGAVLSAVARLVIYGAVCGSVFVFRKRELTGRRVAGGPIFAAVGIALCLVLLARMKMLEGVVLLAFLALSGITWTVRRKRLGDAV